MVQVSAKLRKTYGLFELLQLFIAKYKLEGIR